jgi:hypothetical protein
MCRFDRSLSLRPDRRAFPEVAALSVTHGMLAWRSAGKELQGFAENYFDLSQ